jgi:electron transfer flavoprotein-quinone oxidoreductase
MVIGDSGHFVNGIHREGSNLAMETGRVAAETLIALHGRAAPCTRANLAEYKRRLDASFVMKDMKKYKDLPAFMHHNRHMVDLYPRLMSQASQTWFRVDGTDKLTKEREIVSSFRRGRKITGLLGDAFKLARVWR